MSKTYVESIACAGRVIYLQNNMCNQSKNPLVIIFALRLQVCLSITVVCMLVVITFILKMKTSDTEYE